MAIWGPGLEGEMLVILALTSNAHALQHTAGLRYRYAWIPNGILDLFYFDSDDAGALPYDRPTIRSHVFGLDYTLAPEPGGGASYVLWVERQPFVVDAGYWDDKESNPQHIDGDWLDPQKGFGLVNIGANYMHELPLSSNTQPVWVSMVVGGGLGLGIKTGNITVWHPGPNAVTDPQCGALDIAPDRVDVCADDGELGLPAVLPILDISLGTKLHLTEHASLRFDLGIHNLLYLGVSGGGSF